MVDYKCPSCNAPIREIDVNGFKLWKCETENKYFDVDEGKPTEINEKWYKALAGEKLEKVEIE